MNDSIFYDGINISLEKIAPPVAKSILDYRNKVNRPISMLHAKNLARNMTNGTWRFNGDTIRFAENGMLIDGQHRMMAIVMSGMTLPFLVMRGFKMDVIKTIDQEIKTRSLTDLLAMDGVKNVLNISSTVKKYVTLKMGNTIVHTLGSTSGSVASTVKNNYTIDELLDLYYCNKAEIVQSVSFGSSVYSKMRLMSVSEVAAYVWYLERDKKHERDTVYGFFNRLLNISSTDCTPINLLRDRLLRDKTSIAHMPGQNRASLIAKAWNLYCTGRGQGLTKLPYDKKREGEIKLL